jgi:hypothetical protein
MFGRELTSKLVQMKPGPSIASRKAARIYLSYSEEEISAIVREKALVEIAPSRKGVEHGKGVQERSIRGTARKHV